MARLTGEICEVVRDGRGGAAFALGLVTIDACHRRVAACQRETGGVVLCQGEFCGPEPLNGMAVLASVVVWRSGKLSLVNVRMAGNAVSVADFEDGLNAFGNVTLVAGYVRMLPFQGILGGGVLLDCESGRLEAFDGVTRGALAAIGSCLELASMRIGVTIHAVLKLERLLEIGGEVAFRAFNGRVHAEQRVFGLRMVEG